MFKTRNGKKVPDSTRGIIYLCKYTPAKDGKPATLKVDNEILFDSNFEALEAYANAPNPESQLMVGKTYLGLILEMLRLHKKMKDPEWVNDLGEYL
jgi:hypothetical protein